MNPEIGLLHRHIRPNARDQFPLSDDFSSALDQRDQRVKRTTTELECLISLLELPFGSKQAERTKRDDFVRQWAITIYAKGRAL
jgi:hypothetical protein